MPDEGCRRRARDRKGCRAHERPRAVAAWRGAGSRWHAGAVRSESTERRAMASRRPNAPAFKKEKWFSRKRERMFRSGRGSMNSWHVACLR